MGSVPFGRGLDLLIRASGWCAFAFLATYALQWKTDSPWPFLAVGGGAVVVTAFYLGAGRLWCPSASRAELRPSLRGFILASTLFGLLGVLYLTLRFAPRGAGSAIAIAGLASLVGLTAVAFHRCGRWAVRASGVSISSRAATNLLLLFVPVQLALGAANALQEHPTAPKILVFLTLWTPLPTLVGWASTTLAQFPKRRGQAALLAASYFIATLWTLGLWLSWTRGPTDPDTAAHMGHFLKPPLLCILGALAAAAIARSEKSPIEDRPQVTPEPPSPA